MTENLPLVASADQGTALLRKAILGLAIRGLLVSQDDTDEPAGALLERAAALKSFKPAKLTRASEPVASAPYELPRGWVWTTLPALAVINPRNQAEDDGEASFVPMAAIGTGFADGHSQETRRWGDIKTGFTHFAEGDIGVAKITPCFENSKACVFSGVINGIGAGTTELHVVRPLGGTLAPRYVLAYLKSPWFLDNGESKMTGTAGQKRLPKDFVERHPFPLPPLAEQHRIVAKVDELMALCDRLEARQQDAEAAHARLVQALLDNLTQARDANEFQACWQRVAKQFSVLFTTPASINGLWSAVLCLAAEGKLVAASDRVAQLPIGELLLGDTLNGCSYKPSDAPVGTPILRISAATGSDDFMVDETDHKWVEITAAEREKFRLLPNDLLACRFNGNLHYVGAFAIYNGANGVEQIFPDKLIRFRVNEKRALPGYLRFVMNALPARQQIESFCATTVGNIGISATNLKTVKVRVPSLDEQHRIVAKVTELLALCDQLKARITAARAKHAQLAEALVAQAVAA